MKLIRKVSQAQVFKHWERHDKNMNQMIRDELAKRNFTWSLRAIEKEDLMHINIIYAADWTYDHRLTIKDEETEDYGLENVYNQYAKQIKRKSDRPRALEILAREVSILNDLKKLKLPQKIVLITLDNKNFVCFEGNRRLVAMYSLMKQKKFTMDQLGVYVGQNTSIMANEMPWYSIEPMPIMDSVKKILDEGRKKYVWYNSERQVFGATYPGVVDGGVKLKWSEFCDLHEWNQGRWHLIEYQSLSGVNTPILHNN